MIPALLEHNERNKVVMILAFKIRKPWQTRQIYAPKNINFLLPKNLEIKKLDLIFIPLFENTKKNGNIKNICIFQTQKPVKKK